MKKFSFFLSLALIIGLMVPVAHATPDVYQETSIVHTKLGDFEIETTTIVYDSVLRSNGRNAAKNQSIKFGGKVVAEVTLSVTFGYDGKTSWVTIASGSHTTYDGWSYSGERITKSGGTATLSASLSKITEGKVPVNISMTCSPTGQIS